MIFKYQVRYSNQTGQVRDNSTKHKMIALRYSNTLTDILMLPQ